MNKLRPPIYMPILKGKKGEYDALRELSPGEKGAILPLVELPSIPWSYVDDRPKSTVDKEVEAAVKKVTSSWLADHEIALDASELEENNSSEVISKLVAKLLAVGYRPIPTIRLGESTNYLDSLRHDSKICIRVKPQDLDGLDINEELNRIGGTLKLTPEKMYILLDMGYQQELPIVAQFSLMLIKSIKNIESYLDTFLALTSFPADLSGCSPSSVTKIPRIEVGVHQHLRAIEKKLPLVPKFSDYGVAHPDVVEIDPRVMTMSASIRYTADYDWFIFKGKSVKRYGHTQYYDLAKLLISSKVYAGKDFSWGDKQIYEKADGDGKGRVGSGRGKVGTGNATIWRQIATSHHLAHVIKTLSS